MTNVLVVEDDPWMRDAIVDMLEEAGYIVTTAADGEEATRILEQKDFDLLVTDIIMPNTDGLELIRYARMGALDMRILATTGGESFGKAGELMEKAKSMGADAVLEKPFTEDRLFIALRGVGEAA